MYLFEAEAGAQAEPPRPWRGRGSESWERSETAAETPIGEASQMETEASKIETREQQNVLET